MPFEGRGGYSPLVRVALLASILLLGCGAKTALDEGPPREVDAGPRRDAGFNFSTLPCRWSTGVPVIVHQAEPAPFPVYSELGGTTSWRARRPSS